MSNHLRGTSCLITGANSGIGWATALRLAEMGAEIWMLCRNPERGEAKRAELAKRCQEWGSPEPRLFLADLSDLESVQRVARHIIEMGSTLDILINNAGLIVPTRQESAQGYEYTLAANHLGHFVLTHHLLPLLESAPQGRIINVASRAHRVASIDWDDPHWLKRSYASFTIYGTTKLFNILFTRALASRLQAQGSAVTVNSLHPGVIRTGFGKDYQGFFKTLVSIGGPFLASPRRGAQTMIYLASSPEVAEVSGAYFIRRRQATPRALARSDEQANLLWSLSEELCHDYLPEPHG
jgi:NAD(P)-dependent dehydrogenase (short-subunit alcohol dehydrogenase family)